MENKFVRVLPSNNADADPSSSCDRDYSCLSSMTAGKKTNWDQKFKISITQNRCRNYLSASLIPTHIYYRGIVATPSVTSVVNTSTCI